MQDEFNAFRPASRVRVPWLRAGMAAIFLFLATCALFVAQSKLSLAQKDLQIQKARLLSAQASDELSLAKEGYGKFAGRFMDRAREQGLIPSVWAEQSVDVRQARLSRDEASGVLRQTQSSAQRVFGLQEIDIAPTDLEQGIFADPSLPQELTITLKGHSIFKIN